MYASRIRSESLRLINESQTSIYAYVINELAGHTETPEVQLYEILQLLLEADQF